jgi:transposase
MSTDAAPKSLDERLDRIETMLVALVERQKTKEWYSVDEVASLVGKAAFTVREWCRHGRITAQKRSYKRGNSAEWMISHEELLRVQNQGLLPINAALRYPLDRGA